MVPGIVQNFYVQQGNRQVYLSWDINAGATSYSIQRSIDGVNYTVYATVTANNYLDTSVSVGVQYWYNVAGVNTSGIGLYNTPQSTIPTPTAEMSLAQIRLTAQQRADRVGSNFLTLPEWNSNINQSMYELYDLLITVYEDYFVATPAQFTSSGGNVNQTYLYPLPDGQLSFTNGITGTPGYIAPPLYKLLGVDLGLNTANNAWVTIEKFNFIDRNTFIYPNTASTIYGVFNLRYRLVGDNIEFIPTPSSGQFIRLWYYPRLKQLLQDTDLTSSSISGWIEYVIVDAAIKALQKEESDVSVLMAQKQALIKRIEDAAQNRDSGRPDTISNSRQTNSWGGFGYGGGWGAGPMGGF